MLTRNRVRVFALAVVLALVVLTAIGCGGNSPTSVVENYMSAFKDKNCDKALELIDFKAMEDSGVGISKEELLSNCKEQSDQFELVSYKIIEEKIDGDKATVKVEMTTKAGGTDATDTVTLTINKRDGEWKISLL